MNAATCFRLTDSRDLDAEFRAWLVEAYAVGQQRHVRNRIRRTL
jgi:hypothetical protein